MGTNPLLPRPKGDKDAEGMKKQIPSNNSAFRMPPYAGNSSPSILPNPERVRANLRSLALQSRRLSGGDILNICLNAIHAGSRDHDPAK